METTTSRKARSQAQNGTSKKTPTPVFAQRAGGGVSVAVFEKELENGAQTFSVSIRKAYKDADGEWQHTHTLYQSDLLPASWAIAKAYEWIVGQSRSED